MIISGSITFLRKIFRVLAAGCLLLLNLPNSGLAESASDKSDLWTFKPAVPQVPPQVKNESWIRNAIDRFILAKLEAEKMTPAPEADRRTLIRRLSFDLTGLPPTPEEVRQFAADPDPRAYEKLVDRLLASPRYGERWARHWLDVVHFGETHGYDKDKPRRRAWPYRDYVIRAFNEDKPYSRFVQEQLAGDVLFPDDPAGIVATGFIAAGPWDYVGHVELPETKTDGLIARYNDRDDMVMTTMSTFQSLTVHCARCHNHKFDPISQREYYSLQAVFAGVDRAERPFDSDPQLHLKRQALLAQLKNAESRFVTLSNSVAQLHSPELERLETQLTDARQRLSALPKPPEENKSPSNGYHSEVAAEPNTVKWVQLDLGHSAAIDEIRLVPARPTDFPDTAGFGFPARYKVTLAETDDATDAISLLDRTGRDETSPGDEAVVIAGAGNKGRYLRLTATRLWERTKDYVFALGELQVLAGGTNIARGATVTALDSIEAGRWAKNFLVDGYSSRKRLEKAPLSEVELARRRKCEAEISALSASKEQERFRLMDASLRTEWTSATNRLADLQRDLAGLPAPQMVYAAASRFQSEGSFSPARQPRAVHLLRRGDVKLPGEQVAAGALSCVPGMSAELAIENPEQEGERRAALARWLTHPQNQLTRLSFVNRIWHYHFGRGLVDTPNDFGHMGSRPTHPELLAWLAQEFQHQGESLKQLHRLLVTSATYRQSSSLPAGQPNPDQDNRWLGRMNRQRLDAESIHDSLLAVAGALDLQMGGPSVEQFAFKDDHSPVYDYTRYDLESAGSKRRSIYRFVVRSMTDPFMDTLDCPDPSVLTERRTITTTALQALAMLNNPFVLKQAERLAQRLRQAAPDLAAQVQQAGWLVWNRPVTEPESASLRQYAEKHGLESLCRVLFNSSEFVFVD